MPDVAVSGPNGLLNVEVGHTVEPAELIKFSPGPGDVPRGKAYVGPSYDYYGSWRDGAGELHDVSALGRIEPGTGANEAVVHFRRHTDWDGGAYAVVEGREGNFVIKSRYDDREGVVVYPLEQVSAVNPSHSKDYREAEGHWSLDDALEESGIGF